MMIMEKKIFYCALALLAAVACQKENVLEPEAEPSWQLTLKGGIPTKTSIGTPDDEGKVPFLWKSGDKLGVYIFDGATITDNNNQYALVQSGSDRGPGYNLADFSATVTGLEASKEYSVKLYYPYSYSAGKGGATVVHSIPALQTQLGGSVSNHLGLSGAFASGSASFTTPAEIAEDYSPSLNFELSHKTAYVWIRIFAADSGLGGWRVTSVKLAAPSGTPLAGNVSFNTNSGAFALTSDASNEVTVNLAGGAPLATGSSNDAYMVVYPSDIAGKTLQFIYTLQNEDATQTKVVTHTRVIPEGIDAFTAGSVNRFTEKIPSADASGWAYSIGAIDLSAGGTANCYIVSTPGEYTLDATVIGNGEKGLRSSSYFHSSASISPASAALIWQTKPGLISNVALSGGKLSFTKPDAKEGNALVCVKNASGTILWSWHIWCTDMGAPQTYITPNNTYEVMDRHLGATHGSSVKVSDTELQKECLGLYYQWGRKDPFVGPAQLPAAAASASALAPLYDASGNEIATRPDVLAATTENSTQVAIAATPDKFLTSDGNWHRAATVRNFWGNTPGSNYVTAPSTPEKTIYDPCPPGWMVCPNDMFNAFKTCSGNVTKQGHLITYDGTNKTWVPRQGCMANGTGLMNTYAGNDNSMGYIWKSDFAASSDAKPNMSRMQYSTSSTRGGTDNVNRLAAGLGMNVRCIQELK